MFPAPTTNSLPLKQSSRPNHEGGETQVHLEGLEVSRNISYKPGEQILMLQTTTLESVEPVSQSVHREETKEEIQEVEMVEPVEVPKEDPKEEQMEVDQEKPTEIVQPAVVVFASET